MLKKIISKYVLFIESLGFTLIIILLWINEIFDLPHTLLGSAKTPINWTESLLESTFIGFLGFIVIMLTYKNIQKIKTLEGLLPICSYCKDIRDGANWIPVEKYITDHCQETDFSHSICPTCLQKYFPEMHRLSSVSEREQKYTTPAKTLVQLKTS